jgi:hypothetical protein
LLLGSSLYGELTDLQSLRRGTGLTRTKVARARVLCGLPVVEAEAKRLSSAPEEVAYYLLIATVHGLKAQRSRDLLITALALDNVPTGKGLLDRRRRVRDHEDEALEEVARWLLKMDHPAVLFGEYNSEAAVYPPPEWYVGTLIEPVRVDEIHPREEVVWDFLQRTAILDEYGYAIKSEMRGVVRAVIDRVTGYTLHHTTNTGLIVKGVHIIQGGKLGRSHPPGVLSTTRININFLTPLRQNQTLRLHWILDLLRGPDVRRHNGLAQAPEVPIRDLTLRTQFDASYLPVAPRHFVGEPNHLPEPFGPKQPLSLLPGNFITKSWRNPDRRKVYVIEWQWSDEAQEGIA